MQLFDMKHSWIDSYSHEYKIYHLTWFIFSQMRKFVRSSIANYDSFAYRDVISSLDGDNQIFISMKLEK
jgi:hypothetical protein